jgi:hypothetical protein
MRNLFIALLLLPVGTFLQAQGRLGIKGGTNIFYLNSDPDVTKEYINPKPGDLPLGFTLGASYMMPINDAISIQPEFNISQQRARSYNGLITMTYSQVPVFFQFHPAEKQVGIYVGPQLNFLNGVKVDYDKKAAVSGRDGYVYTDFGIGWGVGTRPNKKGLMVDVRAYNGLSNVIRAVYDNGNKSRQNVYTVTFGYLFNK